MAVTPVPLTIETRAGPMPIDPNRTAVVVVDMQNDFATPGGMFDRGGVDLAGIRATIAPTATVIAAARAVGWPIVYLRMGAPRAMLPVIQQITHDSVVPPYAKRVIASIGEPVTAPDGTQSYV